MAFPVLTGSLARVPGFNRLQSAVGTMGRPVLLTSLAITGLIVGLRSLGLLERPELAMYDQFVRLQPNQPPDDRLLIVGIDEVDLQTLQEWPITDLTLAQTLETLQTHQPRVIGVDILRDIPTGEGRPQLLSQLQQSNVVIVCKVNSADEPGVPPPAELAPENVVFSDLVIDSGGVLRRNLLFMNAPPLTDPSAPNHLCNDSSKTLVSLSFGSALRYLDVAGISATVEDDAQLQVGSVPFPSVTSNLGGYHDADTAGYQIMLRYRAEEDVAPIVSLMDVLNGQVADELIRDRIVLIGYTTPLAKDDFYTPYSIGRDDQQKMPGVIVHAQATSQILGSALDGRSLISAWPQLIEILWIYGWTLATGIFAWYIRHPVWFGSGVLLIGGLAYGASLLIFMQGIWIPIFPALVGIVLTSGGVVLFDRFNTSAYGKQMVRQVKTFLNIDIDIDKEKLDKQVSEITETDYFQDLKNAVQSLRLESNDPSLNLNTPPATKVTNPCTENSDRSRSPLDGTAHTQASSDAHPAVTTALDGPSQRPTNPLPTSTGDSTTDDGLDYLADLTQEAREIRRTTELDS